jgi:predicted amidohydrolase
MRVAVAQFAAGTVKPANVSRVQELVVRAEADLVVLPEAAMHPFGQPGGDLARVAEPLDGPFVTGVAEAAAKTGSTVVAGMFETIPGDHRRAYNTVVAVGPAGILGRYRKVHLFDALGWRESDRLSPGPVDGLLTFAVRDLVVGVLTCYDLRFPELARALVDRGVTLLALPAAWVAGPLKEDHWLTLVRARAIENTCWVAAAGQTPPEYAGRSAVVDPLGVPVVQLGEEEGVAVADASATRVRQVRTRLPCLEHRRFRVVPG